MIATSVGRKMEKIPAIENSRILYPWVTNTGSQKPSVSEVIKGSDGTLILSGLPVGALGRTL